MHVENKHAEGADDIGGALGTGEDREIDTIYVNTGSFNEVGPHVPHELHRGSLCESSLYASCRCRLQISCVDEQRAEGKVALNPALHMLS